MSIACELNLARELSNDIQSRNPEQTEKDIIHEKAKSIAAELEAAMGPQDVYAIESRLTELLDINNNVTTPSKVDLLEFFKVDGIYDNAAYLKAKRFAKQKLMQAILNDRSTLVRTNGDLNRIITALQEVSKAQLDVYDNPMSTLAYYFNMTKDDKTKQSYLNSTPIIVNYLFAANMPEVINSWLSYLVKYDPNTKTYSLFVDSKIRRDWYDNDDDREAEFNSLLQLMCQSTPLIKFNANGEFEQAFENRPLTKTALMASMINEVQNMDEEDYEKYIDNPYYIIDYLVNKYVTGTGPKTNKGAHADLFENVIHSFIYTWINNGEETNMYRNSKLMASESSGYNPIDVIVANIGKFNKNTYVEYNLSGEDSLLTLSFENGIAYSRLIGNINQTAKDLSQQEKAGNIVTNENTKRREINLKIEAEQFTNLCRYFLGSDVEVNNTNEADFKRLINVILDYFSVSRDTNFQDFIDADTKRKEALLNVIKAINMYNPFAISGSIDDKLGKSLPTVGLNSVANSIEKQIYKNRYRIAREKATREVTSPLEHSFLFNDHHKNSERNVFLGTVYADSLTAENESRAIVTKSTRTLSTPEEFTLRLYRDFLDNWNGGEDKKIRIEAITPSDKLKIPLFEFSSFGIKRILGQRLDTIKKNTINALRNIYGQYYLNTLRDFNTILGLNLALPLNSADADIRSLNTAVDTINEYLANNHITKEQIWDRTYAYNQEHGTNINIAEHHDFKDNKGFIEVSPYLISLANEINKDNPLDDTFRQFLEDLPDELQTNLTEDELEDLETYFYVNAFLKENILVNTVGLPLSHKSSGKTFNEMDSNAHVTMVKRMVALTATMHSCIPNALGGLPRKINMMTIKNPKIMMHTYSGNTTEGHGSESEFEVYDGVMFSCRFADNLLKQSIGDTKPKGIDLKLLMHDYDPSKGAAYLSKLANYSMDNALIRMFGNEDAEDVGAINPMYFMRLALSKASFNASSFENGELIDYDGNPISLMPIYKDDDGHVHIIEDITYNPEMGKFNAIDTNQDTNEVTQLICNNNLFDFWQVMLGGANSCDLSGNYNESSQDTLSNIINKVGNKHKDVTEAKTQNDVDQYLKNQIVFYFPTSAVQKSLKCPEVNIHQAVNDPTKAWTLQMDIDDFGIQLDADHSAEDGKLKEITQLISFVAERGYVPKITNNIYRNLAELTFELSRKIDIDLDSIRDPVERQAAQQKLDRVFAPMMIRVLTNPDQNITGIINDVLKHIKANNIQGIKPPYSDQQMLGKFHTSVGSYMNKIISRVWNGRGDVLVPSHNLFMLYEDDDGVKFTSNDFKFIKDENGNTTKVKAREYLRNKVWTQNADGSRVMRPEYIESHTVSPYEVMPVNVYYRIEPNGQINIHVINTWDDLQKASNDIRNGLATYVKAIDKPRNLRSKHAFVDLTLEDGSKQRIGLFHFKTYKDIMEVGRAIDGDHIYKDELRNVRELIRIKKELQDTWENTILTGIDKHNLDIIRDELPEEYQIPIQSMDWVVFNDERLTTNNYSNKFGIQNMNFSEIQQRKKEYFLEHLQDKFKNDLGLNADYILYKANGASIPVFTAPIADLNGYIELTPTIDEDGYRIDSDGERMYKWPSNAQLYLYQYGNRRVEVIYIPNINLLVDDNSFALYRSRDGRRLPNTKMLQLTDENQDAMLEALATAQYESWAKTNTSIVARIPSQSLAFAMNMDTIGYLPHTNNITMVDNMQLLVTGGDLEVIKF